MARSVADGGFWRYAMLIQSTIFFGVESGDLS
jgi:hypothetical protein